MTALNRTWCSKERLKHRKNEEILCIGTTEEHRCHKSPFVAFCKYAGQTDSGNSKLIEFRMNSFYRTWYRLLFFE